ncbi:MAG: tRNA (guanosine(37)-N1)-methyltransferase TrmD [Gemmatimonadota bacterium]|nr:tRNA (guanosine(37)-N1)-methyltransferase TrmD [Gemmatimonadota bacterium]MDH5803597.1 tRNA (guanosine(37)-N1)-methyltransferase TrmD [Gemmatimonadota bacterium]
MLRINVVTLFPEVFAAPLETSILGRAVTNQLASVRIEDLRDFTHDRHRTVDDVPYGGGAGMVLKPEPFFEALDAIEPKGPVALLSARGKLFSHDDAVRYSMQEELTLLCGHYKDVDERVAGLEGVEEIAIGDFVVSGGELPALCVIDAVVRLLPGALGDHESAQTDSHYEGLVSAPSYTRPPKYRDLQVPEVLLSGDHARIAEWRKQRAEELTRERRPDLWARYLKEHGLEEPEPEG